MSKAVSLFGVKHGDLVEPMLDEPNQYLSFFDLDKVVGFMSCKETSNQEEFKRIIYENGADITKPLYVKKAMHRPRTSNIPYDGFMVVFSERLDKAWLSSGAASIEAQLHTDDVSLQQELLGLDPRNHKHVKRDFDDEVECDVDVPEDDESDEEVVG